MSLKFLLKLPSTSLMIRFSVDSTWTSLKILVRFQVPTSFVFHVHLFLSIRINLLLEHLFLFFGVEMLVDIFPWFGLIFGKYTALFLQKHLNFVLLTIIIIFLQPNASQASLFSQSVLVFISNKQISESSSQKINIWICDVIWQILSLVWISLNWRPRCFNSTIKRHSVFILYNFVFFCKPG